MVCCAGYKDSIGCWTSDGQTSDSFLMIIQASYHSQPSYDYSNNNQCCLLVVGWFDKVIKFRHRRGPLHVRTQTAHAYVIAHISGRVSVRGGGGGVSATACSTVHGTSIAPTTTATATAAPVTMTSANTTATITAVPTAAATGCSDKVSRLSSYPCSCSCP